MLILFRIGLASPFVTVAGAQNAQLPTFGAWKTQCAPAPRSTDQMCALGQAVRSEDNPGVGVTVLIGKIPGSPNAVIRLVAPRDVFLLEGAKLKIDQDDIGALPFFKCSQIGCAAEGPISTDVVSKLLNGKNLLVTIYIKPGEGLRNIFPLTGFADGYKALK